MPGLMSRSCQNHVLPRPTNRWSISIDFSSVVKRITETLRELIQIVRRIQESTVWHTTSLCSRNEVPSGKETQQTLKTAPSHEQHYTNVKKRKLNSVALVCKRTKPTEQPPLTGEVSVNFSRTEGVAWLGQRIPTAVNLGFLDWTNVGNLRVEIFNIKFSTL
jgi:hypothetical protein